MGWKLSALLFLVMVFALLAGAFIVIVPLLLYFVYKFRLGPSRPGGSQWKTYLGILLVTLGLVAIGEGGTYSPIVFGGSGLLLLAWSLAPGMISNLIASARMSFSGILGSRLRGKAQGERVAPCVELTKMPLGHIDPKKDDTKERLLRFQRLAQTLAEMGESVEFRLDFASGSGRAAFRVLGKDGPIIKFEYDGRSAVARFKGHPAIELLQVNGEELEIQYVQSKDEKHVYRMNLKDG